MTDEDKQQIVEEYNAAMCASNEAGYAGITAAETIRYLIQRAEAAEAEIARRDAAAGDPYGYVHKSLYESNGSCGLSNDHEAHKVSSTHIPLYTAAPPAVVSDEMLRELLRTWDRAEFKSPDVYQRMREVLGAQPQKPVSMPESVMINNGYYFNMDDIFAALDAANVPWR